MQVPPSFTSSAATLGEISNKLNRQSSDLAYDLTAGVLLLFMIMTLLRGIYGSSSLPPVQVPLTVRGELLLSGISKSRRKTCCCCFGAASWSYS